MRKDTFRLFIASDFQGFTEQLTPYIPAESSIPGYRIKQIAPSQWHLTWAFLGTIEARQVPQVQHCILQATQGKPPMSTPLQDIVWWPSPKKARMIACRLSPTPELIQLASDLSTHLQSALPEFKVDKAFNPHITLARLKHRRIVSSPEDQTHSGRILHPPFEPLPTLHWKVNEIALYQSTLTAEGPIYQPIFTAPLQ